MCENVRAKRTFRRRRIHHADGLGYIKSQLFAGSCMPKFRNMLVDFQFMPPVEGLISDLRGDYFKRHGRTASVGELRPYESVNEP